MYLDKYHKVPFRQVYCETWIDWIRSTLWCHIGIKFSKASFVGSKVPKK